MFEVKSSLKKFMFNFSEKFGFHFLQSNFYSIIPSNKDVELYRSQKKDNGLDEVFSNYNQNLIDEIIEFSQNKKAVFKTSKNFTEDNGYFENLDATFYELIIRKYCPKNIIEIGAGYSTLISEMLNEKKIYELNIIEPYPKSFLRNLNNLTLTEKKLQDVDFSIFEKLKENDILFIDSSHAYKLGSDVYYIFNSILPKLNKGVLVHFHDIFLPNDYPISWTKDLKIFWNEQYFLNVFLLYNRSYKILYPLNYIFNSLYSDKLLNLQKFYSYDYNHDNIGPGSFWIKKID